MRRLGARGETYERPTARYRPLLRLPSCVCGCSSGVAPRGHDTPVQPLREPQDSGSMADRGQPAASCGSAVSTSGQGDEPVKKVYVAGALTNVGKQKRGPPVLRAHHGSVRGAGLRRSSSAPDCNGPARRGGAVGGRGLPAGQDGRHGGGPRDSLRRRSVPGRRDGTGLRRVRADSRSSNCTSREATCRDLRAAYRLWQRRSSSVTRTTP